MWLSHLLKIVCVSLFLNICIFYINVFYETLHISILQNRHNNDFDIYMALFIRFSHNVTISFKYDFLNS